jgi:acetyl-CoA synthetase
MTKDDQTKANDAVFHPDEKVVKQARVKNYEQMYRESIEDREGFWSKEAKTL